MMDWIKANKKFAQVLITLGWGCGLIFMVLGNLYSTLIFIFGFALLIIAGIAIYFFLRTIY